MNDPFGQNPQDGESARNDETMPQQPAPYAAPAGPYDASPAPVPTQEFPTLPGASPSAAQPNATQPLPVQPTVQPNATQPLPVQPTAQTAPFQGTPTQAGVSQPMQYAPSAPDSTFPPVISPNPGGEQFQSAPSAGTVVTEKPVKQHLWLKVGSAALAAACLASVGTAALTGAFSSTDQATPTPQQSPTQPIAIPVSDSSSQNPDWQKVSQAVSASVVAITVEYGSSGAEGSGVIYDADGHILTNNHVIDGGQNGKITVSLADGRIYEAEIVGTDPATDLAVIKIKTPPSDLKPAVFGDSDKVAVGESVIAIGNPLGLSNTATTGIVSALNRPVQTGDSAASASVSNAIQIDAAINPGNSGGPAFNAQGQVIGITSSIATLSSSSTSQSGSIGLGFAIPSNVATDVAKQLISTGVAKHAFLGVTLTEGTATVGDTTTRGAQVSSVTPDTPASAANLQTGDVITAIDGHTVSGSVSLSAYVRSKQAGDVVTLTYVRNGTQSDVKVTLAEREDDNSSSTPTPTPTPSQGQDQQGDGSGMFDPFGLFGGQQQGGSGN